jgi:hypothetical protein
MAVVVRAAKMVLAPNVSARTSAQSFMTGSEER